MRLDRFVSGFVGGCILVAALLCIIYAIGTFMVFVKDNPISLVFIVPVIIGGIVAGVMNVKSWEKMDER